MVEVFVTPLETELEHEVQLGQGGVTSDKESTPDKGTDASQDDTQLIDVWMGLLLFHAQSVRRHTPCFKGSPRYLAVSSCKLAHTTLIRVACPSSRSEIMPCIHASFPRHPGRRPPHRPGACLRCRHQHGCLLGVAAPF